MAAPMNALEPREFFPQVVCARGDGRGDTAHRPDDVVTRSFVAPDSRTDADRQVEDPRVQLCQHVQPLKVPANVRLQFGVAHQFDDVSAHTLPRRQIQQEIIGHLVFCQETGAAFCRDGVVLERTVQHRNRNAQTRGALSGCSLGFASGTVPFNE